MCRGVRVQDEWTYFCGIWVKNRSIVIVLAMAQFVVATVSLAQHVYSVANFNKPRSERKRAKSFEGSVLKNSSGKEFRKCLQIFLCSFNESSPNAGNFLSADVIIFDFGLFHELIQVKAVLSHSGWCCRFETVASGL
ncbi:hypothetical protein ANCDUO_08712 [Ancylostoma duodenale]|uniref:Uncharacterized protein n=1 Tax=Ancylostoma duodenale TaxID=51022 RepID=A0A0C2CVU4_9BILA|nr:hypothetical protein ANCDUO_08712 [Ancylostoma duodenale]